MRTMGIDLLGLGGVFRVLFTVVPKKFVTAMNRHK